MNQKTLLPILAIMATMVVSMNIRANTSPRPFIAHYNAYIHGISVGVATKTLERVAPNQYQYSIVPKIHGLMSLIISDVVDMHCQFNIEHNHIKPVLYTYSQEGGKVNKHIALNFTVDGKQACDSSTGQCWKSTTDTLYDPLSIVFAYPIALDRGIKNCQYDIVTGDKEHIQSTRFKVIGKEIITVNAGTFNTFKVSILAAGKNRPTILWLAENLHYFPVQIIQPHKKYTITLKLNQYQEQNHPDNSQLG